MIPAGAIDPTLPGKTQDGAAASCGPEGGWDYDNPAMPTTNKLDALPAARRWPAAVCSWN